MFETPPENTVRLIQSVDTIGRGNFHNETNGSQWKSLSKFLRKAIGTMKAYWVPTGTRTSKPTWYF